MANTHVAGIVGFGARLRAARKAALAGVLAFSSLLAVSAPAVAQKAFVREDLASSGTTIEERLKRDVALTGRPNSAALVQQAEALLGRSEARRALPLANQAVVADPRNAAAWRVLAKASNAIDPKDWRERYELREKALAAAYLSYQRAQTRADEAAGLALLGTMFEARESWRPALTVYRLSLEAAENAETRTAYEELREKKGFRLLEHRVDSEGANPRACFAFSEPLARGRVDFSPYVAITGKGDFSVTAENSEICVEGLAHGERYGVVLRAGIPSAIPGESLLKNADYDVYVRDRSPAVRFTGKNYVLPRTGQQGLPIVSVNTPKVALEVYRVGDRNLVNALQVYEFLEQLGGSQMTKIGEETGQKVWSGTMDIASDLNKDVVTAFPVVEAVGALKPGVYLLAARPDDGKPKRPENTEDYDYDEDRAGLSTQWFVVSDLGLTSFSGADGVHVLVRSLASAAPVAETEITLVAKNNEILGTAKTDGKGYAKFDAGLARGEGGLAPGLVMAKQGPDFGFLDLRQSAFDLTDRGVSGRVAPKGLDAFVYTERGVYRSGETVFLSALLRDARGAAVTGLPLTIIVKRPDGVEYKRAVVNDQGGGGRAYSIPLISGAQSGTWNVSVHADAKQPAVGQVNFLVEDYVPERLELTLTPKTKIVRSGEPAEVDVSARYLYGAPGAELTVTGDITVRTAARTAIPGFEGFRVGIADEPVEPVRSELEEAAETDAGGKATLGIALKEPETNLPLEAEIAISVAESGGRAVTRTLTLPIVPKGVAVGIKPLFGAGELGEGATASFDVALATGDGTRVARPKVAWQLSRITRNYQWYFKDGRWAYEATKVVRRVADGETAVGEGAPARVAAKVGWGNYRIEARVPGEDGAETAFDFHVGYVADSKADTPDVLDMALDKSAYADGETMQVRLTPRFAGKATLAVVSDKVQALTTVDVAEGGTTVPVKVSGEWGAGAYLVALAHRPLDVAAKRMPGRAIGLSWFTIDRAARTLSVKLNAPELIRPRGTLELPIKLEGLAAGEQAYLTVAAVDVGILNLTRYQSPDATGHFFGQRQLGTELRDLYGFLIDGMQGTRGAFRSGGDGMPSQGGEKPTQEPLARFSGVVKVGADGTARVAFDIPAFNGTARVMAVAWSANRTGEANADVIIRDPVVVQATLPRFLAIGDKSRFHVEINNVEGPAGEYTFDLDLGGPVSVAADATRQIVKLERGQKTVLTIPVTAAGIGTATFDTRLTGGGVDLAQRLAVRVQPSTTTIANRTVRPLPGGGSLTISNDLLADFVPGSGAVSVSVSPFAALDVPALLRALDRYPYGCTEQTVSRALPLLYVDKLAAMEHLALDGAAQGRVEGAVERILARQGSNGSFGLWGVGGDDLWLDSFATDFLTRARERGIAVPQVAFTLALDRLRNQVVNTGEVSGDEANAIAYALYVLARNGRPVMGDLRYLVDNKLATFQTPLSKAQLGGALALLGDRTRSRTVFEGAVAALQDAKDSGFARGDFGSRLRDGAGLLALAAEAGVDRGELVKIAGIVDGARQVARYTSTQEQTWMVLAAQSLAREAENFSLTVDGAAHKGALHRTYLQSRLDSAPVVIGNPGQGNGRAVVTVSGVPVAPEPALDQGYKVERKLYSMKGEVVDPLQLKQNERYVVVLHVSEPKSVYAELLVVDPLPAGLEIENPNLTEGAGTDALSFYKEEISPENREARDDRFVAAFTRGSGQKTSFSIGYIARAVTPGTYVHPAALAEDMYRPDRFGRTGFGTVQIAPAR